MGWSEREDVGSVGGEIMGPEVYGGEAGRMGGRRSAGAGRQRVSGWRKRVTSNKKKCN